MKFFEIFAPVSRIAQ